MWKIRGPIPQSTQITLAVAAWALVIFIWFALTHSKLLPPFALPDPLGVVEVEAARMTHS